MAAISSAQVSAMTNEVKQALFIANNDNEAMASGIKLCDKVLRQFRAQLKKATSTGEKLHLETSISHVLGFRKIFKIDHIIGAGYTPRRKTATHRVKWVDQASAFKERMRTGVVINLTHKDVDSFLDDAYTMLRRRVNNILNKQEAVKLNAVFCGEFVVMKADQEIVEYKYFTVPMSTIFRETNLQEWLDESLKPSIAKQLEEFQEKDSGWALRAVVNVVFNINKYNPQRHGGSSYIPLPPFIAKKEACINIKNDDEACFAWAVMSALHAVKAKKEGKHPSRMSSYADYKTQLNLTNITFPMTLKQIPRFEKLNDISVNIYVLKKLKKEKFDVLPCLLTKQKREKHVNLLLIQDQYFFDEDEVDADEVEEYHQPGYHFVWIKDLSRLVSQQLTGNHRGKKFICDRCLHYFYSSQQLSIHGKDCEKLNECRIKLPEEGKNILKFKNFMNKERHPFIVYSDIESLLLPTKDKVKYQEHVPCSIAYYLKCAYDDSLSFFKSYTGEDCIEWFTNEMVQLTEDLEPIFLCNMPMNDLSAQQQHDFMTATKCHICGKSFSDTDTKVRDHDHLTGEFRGAAHTGCNLNYRDRDGKVNIPVVFHNFSGYDSHFIIKDIATDIKGRIDLLPINKEKFISFTKHVEGNLIKLKFIDSYRFLAGSLEKLASSLKKFPELKSCFLNLSEEQLKLLTRKGVYPYEYMNGWDKLNETCLPEIEKFYSKLNDSEISPADYAHAQSVWNSFECKNLQEYTELYLKTDVLLLADIFENFRTTGLATHKLDPAYYCTLPGYTWDSMLKFTDINLELLTDIDMLLFIERGIRGGLSQCSKRHVKANNKYLPNYDASQRSKYLMYFDINNQYGWAMSQSLPYGGFKWLTNIENFNVFDIADDADEGYFLEVDLKYPHHLHDIHSDLPFCPEHDSAPNSKDNKLLATLHDKKRYVIHYRALKLALRHGLELTKIHRILKFKQSPWLKSYIDLNTTLRTAAINEFDKNFFKLMNNAVYGKTMENVRKHSIVKLGTTWEGRYGIEALISNPAFKSSTILNENLAIIELNKTEILFNKPIYVGMAILDLAKLTTYGFHYDYMVPRFGDKAHVCYTDTDSLIYEVECEDIYKVIAKDCKEMFDTSDYPSDNIYKMPRVNKKVLGMMHDENNGSIMTEFVGLRSKMYATRVEGLDKAKKAKGIKNNVVKNRINFCDYLDCLKNNTENIVEQHIIKSVKHKVNTIVQTKVALSPHDNKRYICSDGIHTLPWGHYSIVHK